MQARPAVKVATPASYATASYATALQAGKEVVKGLRRVACRWCWSRRAAETSSGQAPPQHLCAALHSVALQMARHAHSNAPPGALMLLC